MAITKMTKAAAVELVAEIYCEMYGDFYLDVYSNLEDRYVESFDSSTDSVAAAIEEGRGVRMGIEDISTGNRLIVRFIPSGDGNVIVDIPQ